MRRTMAGLGLVVLLATGCADVTTTDTSEPESADISPPAGAPLLVPSEAPEAHSPKAVVPSPAAPKPVIVRTTAPVAPPPVAAPPVQVPAYVPRAAPPLVYVPPPVTNGDDVTVPVRPTCPTGSVDVSISKVDAQQSLWQGGIANYVNYDLTITGTVRNRTNGDVRLASFNPVRVMIGYTAARMQTVFFTTMRPGGYTDWKATGSWTQMSKYDEPNVSAKALGWKWANDILSSCPAGPMF